MLLLRTVGHSQERFLIGTCWSNASQALESSLTLWKNFWRSLSHSGSSITRSSIAFSNEGRFMRSIRNLILYFWLSVFKPECPKESNSSNTCAQYVVKWVCGFERLVGNLSPSMAFRKDAGSCVWLMFFTKSSKYSLICSLVIYSLVAFESILSLLINKRCFRADWSTTVFSYKTADVSSVLSGTCIVTIHHCVSEKT